MVPFRTNAVFAGALTCLFFSSAGCSTPSESSTDLLAQTEATSGNRYVAAGEQILGRINTLFLKDNIPPGSDVKLYASAIDPNSGNAKSGEFAALWAQENLIRAFYWGARVDSNKFESLLANSVAQLKWYRGGTCPGGDFGYGFDNGGTCFFDDNALLGGILTDVSLHVPMNSADATLVSTNRDRALQYLTYWAAQDPHGGVPQKPVNLGQGFFYMNPVLRVALSKVDMGNHDGSQAEVAYGRAYYDEVNDPSMGLLTDGGLFRGGAQFVNGQWVPSAKGALAGDSASVAALALALRRAGDPGMLAVAEDLMDAMVARWVDANGAVAQDAVTGGYAIVDLLCQVYSQDQKEKYYQTANRIIDDLLANTRDTNGWFPNGTDVGGQWNQVRTGSAPDDQTVLLTQSAAAAAILNFAYFNVKHGS
jgi:hypothetical protein